MRSFFVGNCLHLQITHPVMPVNEKLKRGAVRAPFIFIFVLSCLLGYNNVRFDLGTLVCKSQLRRILRSVRGKRGREAEEPSSPS